MSSGLVLVANARLPSQRAQSLQVAQVAGAFARAGVATTLLHARRRDTPAVTNSEELWDYYALPAGARPSVRAAACIDAIDLVPRSLQYLPARLQELSFARRAAAIVRREFEGSLVLARELECARRLVQKGRRGVFLEIHRVPGGRTRRRWLLEAAAGCAGVVAISGGVREDLVELGVAPDGILVEHDGFEASRFENLPAKTAARAALELPASAQLVVYTGGLLAWKGVDILVDAARELADVQFVIAGGMDADVKSLAERARGLENVRFDGFQPPERVALYLAAGDVGVVPNRSRPAISARYTSPLKVFEAMAAGLPLVVSDLPSLRDVLGDDEALFVPPDDSSALAGGLRRLLNDAKMSESMTAALSKRAGEHSWDARAARLLAWMRPRA